MKRFLVPLVLVMALVIPSQAAAGTRGYTGAVETGGTLSFKLKSRKGKKKILRRTFTFGAIPIQCAAGPSTAGAQLTFTMKVNEKGKFGARAIDQEGGGSSLRVKGKLKRKGRRAGGTIRIFGETPLEDGTTGTECDTGKLSWAAKRTPEGTV